MKVLISRKEQLLIQASIPMSSHEDMLLPLETHIQITTTTTSIQSRCERFQNSQLYSPPFDVLFSKAPTASISAFLLLSSVTVALMSSINILATSSFLRRPDTILS